MPGPAASQAESSEVDAEVAARIRASFASQGLMRLLGAELTSITPGRVQVTLARRPEVCQQHGYVHGGATSAIADTAGGYAALTLMPMTSDVLTVEYKLNLLAPAAGDRLVATGTVLRPGRTLTVCQLEVHAVAGATADAGDAGGRKLVAVGQQTIITIPTGTATQ